MHAPPCSSAVANLPNNEWCAMKPGMSFGVAKASQGPQRARQAIGAGQKGSTQDQAAQVGNARGGNAKRRPGPENDYAEDHEGFVLRELTPRDVRVFGVGTRPVRVADHRRH